MLSLRVKAAAIASLIVVAVIVATALDAWIDYKDTETRRLAAAVDVTRVVRQEIHDTTTQAEVLMTLISRTIVEDFGVERMSEPTRREQLRMVCATLLGCHAIGIFDPEGISVANSSLVGRPNIDVSDRAYFQEAKKSSKLFIGPAVKTRLPGSPILFHLSRGVFDMDDKLLGVIAVAMRTDHFTQFFEMMDFTLSPTVTVFKMNGDVVARNPDMQQHVGKNNLNGPLFKEHLPKASRGKYRSVSVLDGKTRLAAYEAMPELDLVVFAGIELESAFAVWHARTQRTIFIVSLLLVVVLTALCVGYRALRRELVLRAENSSLNRLTNIDPLTGIANRRVFDLTLHREWARHKRTQSALSVLLIDVDAFKAYNDNYGHQAGDEVLRRVALTLQKCVHREVDVIARYGGEEFAAILECSETGAKAVADRMRAAVEALGIDHEYREASVPVTISIGIATAVNERYEDASSLVKAADRALYEAKRNGRNRVCFAAGSSAVVLHLVSGTEKS